MALLTVLALAPLAAWSGAGAPVAAVPRGSAAVTGAIVSAIDGRCLSNYPNYARQRLVADIDKCVGSSSERWTLPADNTVRVQGKCLAAGRKTSGTGLVLARCTKSAGQFWEADGVVNAPTAELLNPWSGKCMTVPRARAAAHTQVRIYTCARSPAQTWYLPPHTPPLTMGH